MADTQEKPKEEYTYLRIEKNSVTFRQFEEIAEKQGYTSNQAGFLAALNFYVQHFNYLLKKSQVKSA